MNWLDFDVKRSKVKVTMSTLGTLKVMNSHVWDIDNLSDEGILSDGSPSKII